MPFVTNASFTKRALIVTRLTLLISHGIELLVAHLELRGGTNGLSQVKGVGV